MADVEFRDYRIQVEGTLDSALLTFLDEAAAEVQSQTQRNSKPVKYGRYDVKGSWDRKVDEAKKEAQIGSPLEASYWEEFGTGEYAIDENGSPSGKGRKGWWVYVEGNDTPSANKKPYTEDEAKGIAASLRAQGLDAHATKGTEANRPLHNAFESTKGKIQRRAEEILKGL